MEYTVRECENWRREVDVKLPADQVAPKLEEAHHRYQQGVKLEGFRKGKIPMNLVKRMFGKKIEDEVFGAFIQESYSQIRQENDFKVISHAEVTEMKYDADEGLSFTIFFDVHPEFTVEGYKGLEIEKEVYEVTSEDVDEYLESLRQDNAMVYTVEEAAQLGHLLNVNLQQLDRTGVPIIGKKYDDRVIELKDADDVLTRQLLGVKAGDERKIRLPVESKSTIADHGEPREREEIYSIQVNSVTERRVPELDDELAKDLGDFNTLAQLREQLQKQLQYEAQFASNKNFLRNLADEIIKNTKLDVPQSMLDRYINAIVDGVKKDNRPKADEEAIRKEARSHAIRNIKWYLIRDKLAQQENLVVTNAEVDEALNRLSSSGKEGAERARKYEQSKEEMDHFIGELLEQKVLNFLARNAKVKEKLIKKESKLAI